MKQIQLLSLLAYFAFSASAQNVGINFPVPPYPLTIKSSTLLDSTKGIGISQQDAAGLVRIGFYTTTGAGAYLQTHSNSDLNFTTNGGGAQMTLQKGTGNVGIGITAPGAKLHVNGTMKITDGTQGAGKVLTSDAAGMVSWATPAGGGGLPAGSIGNTMRYDGTSWIANGFLYNNGTSIGIGTGVPNAKLDIFKGRLRFSGDPLPGSITQGIEFTNTAGTSLNGFLGIFNDSITGFYGYTGGGWKTLFNNTNGNMGLQGNTNPRAPLSFASTIGNKIALWGNADGAHYGIGVAGGALQLYADGPSSDVLFGYGSSSNFTEKMRVKGNGNVGIGTNNPTASLDVVRGTGTNGTARFYGTTYASHFNYAGGEQTYIRGGLATSDVYINDQGTGNVRIADAGGNVGIGLANGNNPTAKLHVNGTMKITDGSQGNKKVLTSDAAGNATWQNQAYGNTERFWFERNTSGNIATGQTLYNSGTAVLIASQVTDPKIMAIEISTSGLYHFDVDGESLSPYQNTNPNWVKLLIKRGFAQIISNSLVVDGLYEYPGNYRISIDKSFEMYVDAPSTISFELESNPIACQICTPTKRITVMGHLISP